MKDHLSPNNFFDFLKKKKKKKRERQRRKETCGEKEISWSGIDLSGHFVVLGMAMHFALIFITRTNFLLAGRPTRTNDKSFGNYLFVECKSTRVKRIVERDAAQCYLFDIIAYLYVLPRFYNVSIG